MARYAALPRKGERTFPMAFDPKIRRVDPDADEPRDPIELDGYAAVVYVQVQVASCPGPICPETGGRCNGCPPPHVH